MKLYITGGGTGGHVTPGLAIARYFQQKRPDTEVRFAGTSKGIESRLVPREGYPLDVIEITGLRRSLRPGAIGHNVSAVYQTLTAQSTGPTASSAAAAMPVSRLSAPRRSLASRRCCWRSTPCRV